MKQFFKTFFACLVAIGVFSFLCILVLIIIGSVSNKGLSIKDKSILYLKLDVPIVDRGVDNTFANFDFINMSANDQIGLNDLLKNIEKAKNDEKIKGIFIEAGMIQAGMATIEEIRNSLIDFKTSGKFILSYSEIYTQKDYYLCSVSDKIYMFPEGILEFRGLNKSVMFLKGLLEKVGIEAQVIRHGKFKSAVEPFILDKMSEANKEQSMNYVSDLWNHMLKGISASRKISVEDLNLIAENLKVRNAEDAVEQKMVDQLKYKDEIIAELKKLSKIEDKEDLRLVKLSQYKSIEDLKEKKKLLNDKIAVIYTQGDIVSGKGKADNIGSESISKEIRKAREDDKVKAVVLRVNSPGGSALASDVIWREVLLTKQVKPVVVSMGDVAASGGYYISCAANEVFASENTITGSIGVFGVIPNMQGFFQDKLGIQFDGIKTNQYADLGSLYRPLNENERGIIQQGVEEIYDEFIQRVADGRKITKANVDSLGQGRVWSGTDAKDLKLIDQYGGLNKAIARAAELAKMEAYQIEELPLKKSTFEAIMDELSGEGKEDAILEKKLGPAYEYFKIIENISKMEKMQTRLPYYFKID